MGNILRKYRHFGLFIACLVCFTAPTYAQFPVLRPILDTLPPAAASSTTQNPLVRDSAVVDLSSVRYGDAGLNDIINYSAIDSMWADIANKRIHLYGQAAIKYTNLEIKAGYILVDYTLNEITASQFPDTSGQLAGLPQFKDKDQAFSATKLRYNFKTKKGIIYEARTQQEDLFVLGQKAKFISPPDNDTTARPTIYNADAIITTCNHPTHPHFGIRTQKLKVIPDKLVVTGFSNLEIGGIPTPFILPFGFYPITKTRKAGVIIPQDFNFSGNEGLGLRDFGWYQPINDHMDATLLAYAYVQGSLGATGTLRYNYRYQSNGTVRLSYNRRVFENEKAGKDIFPSYSIYWSHSQDPKAHPSRKINGSIDIQTNQDQQRNQNDFGSVYKNQLSSNLSYNKVFPGKPYQFTAAFRHSQNTQSRTMNISLPDMTFTLQRIYPFKRKNPVGKERWYEKVSLGYNSQLVNSFNNVVDTLLFTRQTLENSRAGIQHKANSDFNFKLFKYINIQPSVRFEENWYPYHVEKEFIPEIQYQYDTLRLPSGEIYAIDVDSNATKWGRDTTFRNYGFSTYRTFDAALSVGTVLFATKQWKKGWLRGIRHKLTPSISTSFSPDYSDNEYFFREVQTSLRPGFENNRTSYSIFDQAPLGRPGNQSRQILISYGLGNILEIKHATRRDTTGKGKKILLLNNLNFSGSYSPTADSLRWSKVGTGGNIPVWKGVSTLTWRITFDPYQINAKGVRIDTFQWKENRRPLRLDAFGLQLNTSFTIGQLREKFSRKETPKPGASPAPTTPTANETPDDLIGWLDKISVVHFLSYERQYIRGTDRDTFLIAQNNIYFRGAIPLSSKWSIRIDNIGYDFPAKRLTYPSLGITRDLHCWEMSLTWQPDRGTYSFFIAAKPGTFQFLKMPYRRLISDAQTAF